MTHPDSLRERLTVALAAVNAPLLTAKANEQAAWEAVSFLQSHGAEVLAALTSREAGEGEQRLDARIWRRDSTQEWVLELSGSINGCDFICRHTEPLTTAPEDVAGLPSLYAAPPPVAGGKAADAKSRNDP